ncbi:bifunctional hydroxylase/oxidoreductase [Alsobacter metallidurans]|uniref:Bifunctional hydroxylase/oxidoreductase n=1 Tax=Alsobacter metallidurans TaxID=340221 RepID=A0A917I9C0_9HYPH|nr:bifunctional salicylyl-CoA 5-hydroxylase/oxidoreductase [Alsobacter metallidurans]GGH22693.1 bifunctional hydroxylase/oxidoreductase [Alsobacter metallidurans]
MRISIIGGGPAGLYFAILAAKSFQQSSIRVLERNQADDTFGFGVVFSDQTLDNFERADRESYEAITNAFAYWDDISIHVRGEEHRIGGNGFCGCSRRTLLMLLQDRARALGVELVFGHESDVLPGPDEADLVVVADGVNSRFREQNRDHFGTQVDLRPNRFAWMGSTRPFDAFTFFFKETEHGVFIAHCYQYEADRSTWVLETDPETFEKAGLGAMSEGESVAFMERIFAEELQGHPLIANRSLWRQFPMIRNARWTMNERVVLLGDAKATAHFSIGSGTKLAMEDSIALHRALVAERGAVATALGRFETGRREEVEKTQHAADVSLVWFEHVKRFLDMDPVQFAFGLMTRAKSITYDNLELRAPDFVRAVDRSFAAGVAKTGLPVDAQRAAAPAFQPLRLRELTVPNRLVMSPMCMYSAVDGMPGDFHLVHYGSRAMGGAGLIFTEMTCVAPDARITPGCTGLWNDAQQAAWTRIVDFVHANSAAKICLQVGHAGRKGATRLMWEGMDRPLPEGGWDIVAPSPLPYYPESRAPKAMDRADMDRVRDQFVAVARRADACGFDMLELHAAHGYLLASFLSPVTNQRTDAYGGSIENRLRFPLEVFGAMREAWPAEKPMSVRISATDWIEGGLTGDDAVAIAENFAQAGVDLVDVSTGQTSPASRPFYGRMFQTPYAEQIRNEARVATMCVGNITSVDQANTILAAGRSDLVAFGRPHLADPAFALRAAAWYGAEAHPPKPYAPGWDQLKRNTPREKADLTDLKLKAKPKSHRVGA